MGIAYGFRWDGSATIYDMLTGIAAADSRFTVTFSGTMINTYSYQDGTYNEYLDTPGYLMYTLNGNYSAGHSDPLVNNGYFEMEEWGDCYPFPSATPIVPATDPNASTPEEATIAFSDILFWVGEGTNEAVMAVNWADTALAWGYRWNGTATVADMMADIAAADSRFSYTVNGFLDDINYIDADAGMTTPLAITPGNWWGSTNNGFMDMGLGQTLANGDFEKWADPAAGVIVDSTYDETYQYWWYTYVYPMTITPVTVPANVGIDDHEISRVYAYPNPCIGTLNITNENAERVELYNADGKLLEAIETLDTQVILNMQQYPAGLYLLKVGNGVQKILKK